MDKWYKGSGDTTAFANIVVDIKNHANINGKVYIGTDSQVIKEECVFSTAICLHGADNQEGGKYYIRKIKFNANKFPSLFVPTTPNSCISFTR